MTGGRARIEITATDAVRWACYICFFTCAIVLVTTLTVNGPWLGFLVGTLVFGIGTLRLFAGEIEERRYAKDKAAYQAPGQDEGWARDDTKGDPTVPPQRPGGRS